MHPSMMQSSPGLPPSLSLSPPRRAERPIHHKVTLNQLHQEGLKTDKPFSACPELSLLSALTHPHSFIPDNSLYPWRTSHKKKERQDNGRRNAIRHPWLIQLLDLHRPNKTLLSAYEPTGISIMHREQVGEHQERGKSSHDWSQRARKLCLPKSLRWSETEDEDS